MPLIVAAFVLLLALGGGSTRAQGSLKQPQGEVILEISGQLAVTNATPKAAFDRDMLEALGSATVVTSTPWHTGTVRFEGVPMTKLMAAVGARGKTLRATALNDYVITIPIDNLINNGAILALGSGPINWPHLVGVLVRS